MPSNRELWDAAVTEIMAGIYECGEHGRRPPESMYGTLKMSEYLQRQGIPVAKCTAGRLKNGNGWHGRTRGRRVRTTIPDPAASRAPDLVNRQSRAQRPGQLHVADFTYVPLMTGRFCYTAFIIDAFAGLIPGWECSMSKETEFIESALRQAMDYRKRKGQVLGSGAIHHSDAGSYEAERTIRPVKVQQRSSGGCWRTLEGLADFAIVQSYLSTAAKWGISKLDALRGLFGGRAWIPPASNPTDNANSRPCHITPLALAG